MTISASFVRVHIWEHSLFLKEERRGETIKNLSPGHVALEVHTGGDQNRVTYISFWPSTKKCCAEDTSHFHQNYQTDKNAEYKKDSQRFDIPLSKEGADKIITAYRHFKATHFQWSTLGSSIFRRSYESNCAGLSLHLLEAGDVDIGSVQDINTYRWGLALLTSLIVFGGLNLFAYRKVPELYNSLSQFKKFLMAFSTIAHFNEKALSSFQEITGLLDDKLLNCAEEEKKLLFLNAQQLLHDTIEILSTSVELSEEWSPAIQNSVHVLQGQFYVSMGALMSPLALSASAAMINQKIWLKTVTPSDIKKIAEKIHRNQIEEDHHLKNYDIKIAACLTAAVCGIYFYFKSYSG